MCFLPFLDVPLGAKIDTSNLPALFFYELACER